jgi:hypothetical protein
MVMEKCSARIVHGYRSGKPLLILVAANGLAAMVDLAKPLTRERTMQANGHSGETVKVLTEAEMVRAEMVAAETRRRETEAAEFEARKREAAAIEREIDERLEAELQAKRAAMRQEIASRMRHEEFKRKMDWINRPRPDLESPPTPEEQARLDEQADRSRAERDAKLAANDERWREQEAERERALNEFRAKPPAPRKFDEHGFPV